MSAGTVYTGNEVCAHYGKTCATVVTGTMERGLRWRDPDQCRFYSTRCANGTRGDYWTTIGEVCASRSTQYKAICK